MFQLKQWRIPSEKDEISEDEETNESKGGSFYGILPKHVLVHSLKVVPHQNLSPQTVRELQVYAVIAYLGYGGGSVQPWKRRSRHSDKRNDCTSRMLEQKYAPDGYCLLRFQAKNRKNVEGSMIRFLMGLSSARHFKNLRIETVDNVSQ